MPTCCCYPGVYADPEAGSPCPDMGAHSLAVGRGSALLCICRLPVGGRHPPQHLVDCCRLVNLAGIQASICPVSSYRQMSSQ